MENLEGIGNFLSFKGGWMIGIYEVTTLLDFKLLSVSVCVCL